jgi:DNA-binding transcriptional ArsR family regulator
MLRIHFTAEDFARTTLMATPDPLWEVLLSLHMLQVEDGPVPFGSWRQRIRRRLPRDLIGPLTALAPPVGYSPDFLTPAAQPGELGEALDLMLSTPRQRLRRELSLLPPRRTSGSWVRELAGARPEAIHQLGHAVRRYHRSALAPYWSSIQAAVRADHRQRRRTMTSGGVNAVLEQIHPGARWQGRVLEIAAFRDHDLHLAGRGIRLQPSYFCWGQPTKLMDPVLPPVLVFPIQGALGLTQADRSHDDIMVRLAALLGRTRALVLARTAHGATATELARHCEISMATVSHQTSVLREAGLIESDRRGRSVFHFATALGNSLLEGALPSTDTRVHDLSRPDVWPDLGPVTVLGVGDRSRVPSDRDQTA